MGENITKGNGDNFPVIEPVSRGSGDRASGKSSSPSSSGSGGDPRGRGSGRSERGAEEVKGKENNGLAILTEEERKAYELAD